MDIGEYINNLYKKHYQLDNRLLFIVAKNTNKNCLSYLYDNETQDLPIKTEWYMWENLDSGKSTPSKEPLTFLENSLAYGLKKINEDNLLTNFNLVSYSKLPLTLNKENNPPKVTVNIKKKDYHLLGIYVDQDPHSLTGKVNGITAVVIDNGVLFSFYISNN